MVMLWHIPQGTLQLHLNTGIHPLIRVVILAGRTARQRLPQPRGTSGGRKELPGLKEQQERLGHKGLKGQQERQELLAPEFEKPYFAALTQFVRQEYATHRIYPRGSNIFRAFDKCPFDKLKVVIIGQDPYHGPGQANGLCFSVGDGVPFPPSLQNIFKEVSDDTGTPIPPTGNLDRWAEQGVLLLNAVLTVRAHEAASHAGHGWETFTDAVVRAIAQRKQGIVYMLWGSYAQKKGAIADPQRNCILKAVHPSPLSVYRGFFGCRHFSRANEYLRSVGQEPIVW